MLGSRNSEERRSLNAIGSNEIPVVTQESNRKSLPGPLKNPLSSQDSVTSNDSPLPHNQSPPTGSPNCSSPFERRKSPPLFSSVSHLSFQPIVGKSEPLKNKKKKKNMNASVGEPLFPVFSQSDVRVTETRTISSISSSSSFDSPQDIFNSVPSISISHSLGLTPRESTSPSKEFVRVETTPRIDPKKHIHFPESIQHGKGAAIKRRIASTESSISRLSGTRRSNSTRSADFKMSPIFEREKLLLDERDVEDFCVYRRYLPSRVAASLTQLVYRVFVAIKPTVFFFFFFSSSSSPLSFVFFSRFFFLSHFFENFFSFFFSRNCILAVG